MYLAPDTKAGVDFNDLGMRFKPSSRAGPGDDWLQYGKPTLTIRETDIKSRRWVEENRPGQECKPGLHGPNDEPWWHPRFVFKRPAFSVQVQLFEHPKDPRKDDIKLWDVVFAGKPGNRYTIPNDAVPIGGKMPLFPWFCKPLKGSSKYQLRVRDMEDRFEESIELRPMRYVPCKKDPSKLCPMSPVFDPRPNLEIPISGVPQAKELADGAFEQSMEGIAELSFSLAFPRMKGGLGLDRRMRTKDFL